MMTQAYHNNGEIDPLYRYSDKNMPSGHYYDRSAPYDHYSHYRRNHRSEYVGRHHPARTMIHEPEATGVNGHGRKRIGVACTRCRKRKIKCTGDPGDGSGCGACKSQAADHASCTFNRVGSSAFPEFEDYLARGDPVSSAESGYGMEATSGQSLYQPHARPSLPTLHTRTAYPESLDSSYEASPVDGYPYPSYSMPRSDSMNNSPFDNGNGYRPWTSAPMLPPSTTPSMYEQQPTYSFGSMQTPALPASQPQQQLGSRLPSVSADPFSNMGHLYTSLPTQTAQDRRLPIPHTMPPYSQSQYSSVPEVPEIRPLAEPRMHRNNSQSRFSMPWMNDASSSSAYNTSMISLAPPNGLPMHTSMMPEPTPGYHYHTSDAPPHTASPSVSPTTGPPVSNSYNPPYTLPPASYGLPPITTIHPSPSDLQQQQQPYTYSFGSDATSGSDRTGSDASSTLLPNNNASNTSSYPSMRHPQPQHPASLEHLRRQASFEQPQSQSQQAQRQRISVGDLSGRFAGS